MLPDAFKIFSFHEDVLEDSHTAVSLIQRLADYLLEGTSTSASEVRHQHSFLFGWARMLSYLTDTSDTTVTVDQRDRHLTSLVLRECTERGGWGGGCVHLALWRRSLSLKNAHLPQVIAEFLDEEDATCHFHSGTSSSWKKVMNTLDPKVCIDTTLFRAPPPPAVVASHFENNRALLLFFRLLLADAGYL